MIEWYLKVVRDNYANFNGRARRAEYWYFALFNIIILLPLYVLAMYVSAVMFVYWIYAVATFVPGLAVAVRRLHDIGKSGWFYLVVLIPIAGPIWLLVMLATEGTPGTNEYGPNPKGNYNEFEQIGRPEQDI